MNKNSFFWIVAIIVIVAVIVFKLWDCGNHKATKGSTVQGTVNDSLTIARWMNFAEEQTHAIDSLTQSNGILLKMLENCEGTHHHTYRRKVAHVIFHTVSPTASTNPPFTPTVTETATPSPSMETQVSTNSVTPEVINKFCGMNNYIIFSIQLNANDGNWWPQYALDKDPTWFSSNKENYFSHAVENPTKDGLNFKFYSSEFIDRPNGSVCVTNDGSICIPVAAVNKWLGSDKIVNIVIWTGTIKGFQPMILSGDNYVYALHR